ncbi:nuclear transport factor 2 family protein [Pelagovum pacificum]|uniref:Nuclear transport factor 2 family protein n=1 Tax=Pelagovum pacificum TaxID=2588711 RepID=A0A5C5G8R9_9RHOB|nr:nuclear transport factor 2 family protein [Pelagovum pacificum]QQA42036.1 nuclear transport factor 2 family protein [Pelagovum pacificum]TNY31126.1 nuclear transport factor 2 family protein [Pelagovum pacificum]
MIHSRLPGLTALLLAGATCLSAEEVRPNVDFDGQVEEPGSDRAAMQDVMFDFAAAWATCDASYMERSFDAGVQFSYPTTSIEGLDAMLADLELFCGQATDTSFYFPADAFYIDTETGRIAAEVQFRTIQRGARQVVNDVWVATVEDGKGTILKEYLDGRVKDLQALGVLQYEESPEFLTPWPPRTEEWEACFPIARAAPINTCPPTE